MKELKRRRNIERATLYKVTYTCYLDDEMKIDEREFKSTKSLDQWEDRNDSDNTFGLMVLCKSALIDDIWEPYTVIGKKTITLSDLKNIVLNLEEYYNSSNFNK